MAGKIIADTIEASGSQISLNVGNVTVLTASSTGTGLTTANITTANITTANIASISGAVVATQANQETATSTTTLVTPARQQFHPSAAKAWVTMSHTGTITGSYNVTSVTEGGVGIKTVDLTTSFSSTSYCVVSATDGGGGGIFCGCTARATGSFTITTYNTSSQVAQEAGLMFASAFGDQ